MRIRGVGVRIVPVLPENVTVSVSARSDVDEGVAGVLGHRARRLGAPAALGIGLQDVRSGMERAKMTLGLGFI